MLVSNHLVNIPNRPLSMPCEGVLALHDQSSDYKSFEAFRQDLPNLLREGTLLEKCIEVTLTLGFVEPLTGRYIPPEAIQITGPNYRESIIANGLLSRNRAVLHMLERCYGTLEVLAKHDVYLVEALSGMADWLRKHLAENRLICSEFLEKAQQVGSDILHQDLCSLTFPDASFDLVLCNEIFEHVSDLDLALREIVRVLRPGGRLVATCPMAFGQRQSIIKALPDPNGGAPLLLGEAELHGDPIRPEAGSLVYRIPGWELIEQLVEAGFANAKIQHLSSWKHGILGADLPGILVITGTL